MIGSRLLCELPGSAKSNGAAIERRPTALFAPVITRTTPGDSFDRIVFPKSRERGLSTRSTRCFELRLAISTVGCTAIVGPGADADKTAAALLAWMDDDPYAFCYRIEKDAAAAFDKAGLAAFEKRVRARFEAASAEPSGWPYRHRSEILRAIYCAQRDIDSYVALTEQTGLKPEDCLALAKLHIARRKPGAALSWVERGRTLDREKQFGSAAACDLDKLQRELLIQLGRQGEAVEFAWAEFRKHPSKFTYDDLMKFAPKAERAAWRAKALDAAGGADLHSALELLGETKDIDRLADLVRGSPRTRHPLCHGACRPEVGEIPLGAGRAALAGAGDAHRGREKEQILRCGAEQLRMRPRLLRPGGPRRRVGADRAAGDRRAFPQEGLHRRVSEAGGRREARRAAVVSGGRQTTLAGEARIMKKVARRRNSLPLGQAALDELIEEITVDAHGEDEQLWAFRQAFEDNVTLPTEGSVVGEPVQVIASTTMGMSGAG